MDMSKFLIVVCCVLVLLATQACLDLSNAYEIRLESKNPPSFTLVGDHFLATNEIERIAVVGHRGKEQTLVWVVEIIGHPVPADGFTFTLGDVPEGFVQIIPPRDSSVSLKRAEEYAKERLTRYLTGEVVFSGQFEYFSISADIHRSPGWPYIVENYKGGWLTPEK